jgi:hypothetical protein
VQHRREPIRRALLHVRQDVSIVRSDLEYVGANRTVFTTGC